MAQSRRFFWWPRRILYGVIGGCGGVRVKKILLGGPEESYLGLWGVPVKKILLVAQKNLIRGYRGFGGAESRRFSWAAQKNLRGVIGGSSQEDSSGSPRRIL